MPQCVLQKILNKRNVLITVIVSTESFVKEWTVSVVTGDLTWNVHMQNVLKIYDLSDFEHILHMNVPS